MSRYTIIFIFNLFCLSLFSQNKAPENTTCLACHANHYYSYTNTELDVQVKKKMASIHRIDTVAFSESNHSMFKCTDCHSPDYSKFPHDGNLRMEMMYACNDCHAGDDEYAKYHFEEIESAFYGSTHIEKLPDSFTCWSCHDPHSYKTQSRSSETIAETIAYDNNICLRCHADESNYELLSDNDKPEIVESHKWLPNQKLHFQNLRCVECHGQLNDSLIVSHVIMSKDNAIRNCAKCHSQNSHLMGSLYKFQNRESRKERGFLNAVILNESYVIGANRNVLLNGIGILLFALVFSGIIIHIVFRIFKS